MEKRQIGVVYDLFRCPVKSMQGERLHAVEIGVQGIVGDRAYALHDLNGRFATSKKWPTMLEFSARYDTPPVSGTLAPRHMILPDGKTAQTQAATPRRYCLAMLNQPNSVGTCAEQPAQLRGDRSCHRL